MNNNILVFNIQKFSVHDGPGIRTIIFFKGCPLKCEWCANPESHAFVPELMFYPDKCIGCGACVDVCKAGCITMNDVGEIMFDRTDCINCCKCVDVCYAQSRCMTGNYMTLDEIKAEADKDLVFYKSSGGGVTFSGGEAMCFPEAVQELAKYYKEIHEVTTAIETCGFVPWENYEKVIPYLDLVMYDLKIVDDEKHIRYTGGSNKLILDNLRKICKSVDTVIRIPIIPTINDSDSDIEDFGNLIQSLSEWIHTVHILPYHNMGLNKYYALGRKYGLEELKAPSDEKMEEIKNRLETFGFEVIIGG